VSYYQGDFYRRPRGLGLHRGDPGFFSFLGGVAKSALGFIPGVGPILSKVSDIVPTGGGGMVKRGVEASRGAIVKAGSAIVKHPVLSAAGAAGAVGAVGAAHHLLARHAGIRKHKRMNVCNPRALRRAIRRTHAFARLAMKTIHLVHPKKKARFGGFKVKRKRK